MRAAQADLKRHFTQTSESPFSPVARHNICIYCVYENSCFVLLIEWSFTLLQHYFSHIMRTDHILMYSITCIQRPPNGSDKSGLLLQVVFKCRFYLDDFTRGVVSEQWSLKAVDCLTLSQTSPGFYMSAV